MDWLNEQTAEDIHFFGVQISVVRIGDSIPAPFLEVVAKPNDWQKQVRSAVRSGSVSGRRELYRRFWTRYLERLGAEHPSWARRSTPQPQNWMNFGGPMPGTQINPSFAAGNRLRHELYIDSGDSEENERIFDRFVANRSALEQEYGAQLEFEPLEGRRACRIAEYREGVITEERAWDDYITWFIDRGQRLRAALDVVPSLPHH